MHNNDLERRALHLSIAGALAMAVIGIGFALLSGSEAIMLDGIFSAIGLVMALVTLKVATLVARPDDEHFHFGYAHFAPLQRIGTAIRDLPNAEFTVRLLKMGSKLNILSHIVLPADHPFQSVSQLEAIHTDIARSLDDMEVTCIVDVVFTSDPTLAE